MAVDAPVPAPAASSALAGRRVLVTRPAHQADNLCRLIEEQGGKALRLPLLSIVPAPHAAGLKRLLETARSCDGWIFTSTNAVQQARALCAAEWPAQIAAIGAATAAALESAGLAVIKPSTSFSSEGLLELPQFQELRGRRLLIVTGEDGLGALLPALIARGAQVEVAEVYRRVPLPYDGERVAENLRAAQAVVVTSGQALEHLLRLTPEGQRERLLRMKLVVPGARMVEKASELGFRAPFAPERMTDAGIVQVLVQALSAEA